MPLNETFAKKQVADFHYIFIEKIGPFQKTAPAAWQEFHRQMPAIMKSVQIAGVMALYRVGDEMIYRAGAALASKLTQLPDGFRYEKISGGPYNSFMLTGSYSQLPEACGRVFEIIETKKLPCRSAFNIESYLNDPATTPENELRTEILISTTD